MKSLGKFPDRFVAEIAEQPQALRRAGRGLVEQAGQLARLRAAVASSRSILFTGMGSSYDACYPIVTALAGQGRPCSMLDTAELLHFRMPLLHPDSLLVCVSQSGESAELVRLIDRLPSRGRPTIAAVTNGSANTLAAVADITGSVRILSASDGQTLLQLRGETAPVGTVAYSPDGQLVAASAGLQRSIIINSPHLY